MATSRVMRKIRQVAEQHGMRRCTVYNLICRGQLGRTRVGRAARLSQAEVDRLRGHTPGS
jgi:excisionase family DNA binding protein